MSDEVKYCQACENKMTRKTVTIVDYAAGTQRQEMTPWTCLTSSCPENPINRLSKRS